MCHEFTTDGVLVATSLKSYVEFHLFNFVYGIYIK